MKIFQLIHWLTKLFKLNNRSKIILLILLPLPIFSQNNAAFWLGKRSAVSDPYFSNVSLLLHMDGANGSTTFTDDSNNNFTITANGNAQISTVESKFNGASGKFDGSGDYIKTPNDIDFNFGSGDFTLELWVYLNAIQSAILVDMRTSPAQSYPTIYVQNNQLRYFTQGVDRITGETLSNNTWHHIAVSRFSGITKLFLNGNQTGQIYIDNNNYLQNYMYFGIYLPTSSGASLNGYLDDIRITKGIARYTFNFTPPTAPFPDN